ncbi:MAG: pyruvate kinase [Verrucomicrobiota bacterium JB023]|nr:pyruvate kinase [Verrucomicrobiota bacterium JB023]
MRRTRLLATLGPASDSDEVISRLLDAGTDCFRINMSHAKHEVARDTVRRIRRLSVGREYPVGVLFDLTGPSIRTGTLPEPYQLEKGDRVEFRREGVDATLPISTTVNYPSLMDDVKEGATLIVDNGTLIMTIESITSDHLIAVNNTPGELGSRRHINLPGTRLNLPALTEKDRKDLELAVECQADFVAGSFVRDAGHVRELRSAIHELGGYAQVVSKLEDQEAMKNLDDIIKASDIIMVARGDLGIEVHIEELPIIQRRIVKRCLEKGRRVIVATHMLESMISNPTPTRAEVTDIANAVFEEADALMVSGETSIGKYPVECIETLDRVARRIERSGGLGFAKEARLQTDKQKTIRSAIQLADSIPGALLAVFTRSGTTAHHTALLRPRSPIFAFTPDDQVRRFLTLSRGVRSFRIDFGTNPRETIALAVKTLRDNRDIAPGTPLVVVADTLQDDRPVSTILLEHA